MIFFFFLNTWHASRTYFTPYCVRSSMVCLDLL